MPVRSSADCRIQPVGNAVEILVEQVRVDVQRHAGLGVSEHPLNRFDVRVGTDGQARRSVPQIVRMDRVQVPDLRVPLFGLDIATVGVVLGYWM